MHERIEQFFPDSKITPELLQDGSFLKKAINICNSNRNERNFILLSQILRDSFVWIPCSAVLSDSDYEAWAKKIAQAQEEGGLDSLSDLTFVNRDEIRMVPDILQSGENFFFPVFTSAEEMGEYGNWFSKVEKHFLEAMSLAKNNEKKTAGIVINAFSEPFVVPVEIFDLISQMKSNFED